MWSTAHLTLNPYYFPCPAHHKLPLLSSSHLPLSNSLLTSIFLPNSLPALFTFYPLCHPYLTLALPSSLSSISTYKIPPSCISPNTPAMFFWQPSSISSPSGTQHTSSRKHISELVTINPPPSKRRQSPPMPTRSFQEKMKMATFSLVS